MAIINSFVIWRMKKRFHQIELFIKYPHEVQKDSLATLLKTAEGTEWGKRYDFKSINSYETFKNRIKLQDYNSLKGDIARTKKGEKNILWPTDIKWFAQSSGTTSDKSKFIALDLPEAIEENSTHLILKLLSPDTNICLLKVLIFFFTFTRLDI